MIDGRDIPESWARCQIQEVASANKTCNPGQLDSGTFRYVDIEAIDNIHHKVGCPREINNAEAPSRARMHLRAGDVLFCLVRPYLKNIAIIPPDLDNSIGSTAFCVLHPDAGVDNLYLYNQFLQDNLINSIPTYGTSPPSARDLEFLAQSVAIAPLNEQRRIVAKIEELFSELDAGVAALERVRASLKRYRAAVLKAAVEGKLTEDWRAQHPDTEPASALLDRILAERRRRWGEAQLAKFAEVGKNPSQDWRTGYVKPTPVVYQTKQIPPSWTMASGDELFSFITSGSRGWAKYYSQTGPIFLRVGNLNHNSISIDFTKVQRVVPPDGTEGVRTKVFANDILISVTADIGMVGLVPEGVEEAYVNQHVAIARPVGLIATKFLAWFLSAETGGQQQFRDLQRGATKQGLGLDDIRSVSVSLPPIEEQEFLVSEIESRLSIVEEIEAQVEANLKRADRLRQGILKRAFEGRLVPQDPTDEPAEQLLARIRQQRAAEAKPKPSRPRKRPKGNDATPLLPEDDVSPGGRE